MKFGAGESKSSSGSLGFIEFKTLPFVPERLYWIHSVPLGESRGNHAHKTLRQFLFLVQGEVKVELSNGKNREFIELKKIGEGILLEPGFWRVLRNFSPNCVVGVICDQPYDENDYIRDEDEFLDWVSAKYGS